MSLRQIIGYAIVSLLLFFVIKDPGGAAHVVNDIGAYLSSIAHGFTSFTGSL
jgi:hypothetical protein